MSAGNRGEAGDRGQLPTPAGIEVREPSEGLAGAPFRQAGRPALEIVWRWRRASDWRLAIFPLLFGSALVVNSVKLVTGASRPASLGSAVGGLLVLAVMSLLPGYAAVAQLLNRTRIRVADGELTVRHGPIPWPGGLSTPIAVLGTLHARRYRVTGEQATTGYGVHATTAERSDLKLAGNLHTEERALYVAQQLALRLGLRDDSVPGA